MDPDNKHNEADESIQQEKGHPEMEARLNKLEKENANLKGELQELKDAVVGNASRDELADQIQIEEGIDGDTINAKTSRRGIIAGLACLGLLGASGTTSAESTSSTSAGTTLEFGGSYSGDTSSGHGLKLTETSNTGTSFGLRAESDSTDGQGVLGLATASTGRPYGVNGFTVSERGVGVRGKAADTGGRTFGVLGVAESPFGKALQGTNFATSDNAIGLEGRSDSFEGYGVRGRARAGSGVNYGVAGFTNSSRGWGVFTPDDAKIGGDLLVQGTKNFVQSVQTDAGHREVVYTAIEDAHPRTEHSGVTKLEEGQAIINLPDHFSMVTSNEEEIIVQLTPYDYTPGLHVKHRSLSRIIIESKSEDHTDTEFAYTVKGIRSGYEDQNVVRSPSGPVTPDKPG